MSAVDLDRVTGESEPLSLGMSHGLADVFSDASRVSVVLDGDLVGTAERAGDGTWWWNVRDTNRFWPPINENVAESREAALLGLGMALARRYV